jgi:hypothetical protein
MDPDLVTIVRSVNIIGCLSCMWFLATSAYRQWARWNVKTQAHWWALTGWVILGFESTVESFITDIPGGPRTVVATLVIAWTIRALLVDEELNSKPSIPWKNKPKGTAE